MGKIIYLTGAPATGKSTLTARVAAYAKDVEVFTYSLELARVTSARVGQLTQNDMREQSAKIITREDVALVDEQLIDKATSFRQRDGFLVVDSHPVTIEKFGFRVTPFTKEMLSRLSPDVITCLYADAATLEARIKADAAGRPLPSRVDLNRHVDLQCQVAWTYAFESGASLYFLDAALPGHDVMANFMKVAKIPDITLSQATPDPYRTNRA